MTIIAPDTLQFLREVKDNNNREWFSTQKNRYTAARDNIGKWLSELIALMKQSDDRILTNPPRGVGRIYRDIRFSPDKTPYRTYLGAMIFRAPQDRNCEFYIHFEPGNIFAGGGIYMPDTAQLKLIRDDLSYSTKELEKIIKQPDFKKYFGEIVGEKLQRAPKGYSPDHPAIEWLRFKQFLVLCSFTDRQVLQKNFQEEVYKTFQAARPFFDHIDRALNFKE